MHLMKIRRSFLRFIAASIGLPALWLAAQSPAAPRDQMIRYLNDIAKSQLATRTATIATIQTRADADRRKSAVREKILHLIGGLPVHQGPLQVSNVAVVAADGFRVDKIAYESMLDFWVTADVYVRSSGSGPFPAILF